MSTTQKPAAPEAIAATPSTGTAPAATKTPTVAAKKPARKTAVARKRPAPVPAPGPKQAAPKQVAAKKAPPKAPARKSAPAKPVEAPAVKKIKQKLVRDSFTMPSGDFALIDQLKARAIAFKRPAKKSELLRAGLQALAALSDAKLKSVLDALTPLKAGRPRNGEA